MEFIKMGKNEIKLSLFAHDMTMYKIRRHLQIKQPHLAVRNEFSNLARCKINKKNRPHLCVPAMNVWNQNLKHNAGLLVSSLAWKKLELATLILKTSTKMNKLKNRQVFLDLSEKWGHRANYGPPKLERPKGRYRESQLIGAETQKHKPRGNQCQG